MQNDDPDTKTTFRASVKRETIDELVYALGLPNWGGDTGAAAAQRTVIVTALGGLSPRAKADLIQFLQGER